MAVLGLARPDALHRYAERIQADVGRRLAALACSGPAGSACVGSTIPPALRARSRSPSSSVLVRSTVEADSRTPAKRCSRSSRCIGERQQRSRQTDQRQDQAGADLIRQEPNASS